MGALAALAGAAGSKGLAKKGRQDIADEVALLLGARQLEPVQLALPTPAVESELESDADEEDDDEDDDDEVDDGDDQSLGE